MDATLQSANQEQALAPPLITRHALAEAKTWTITRLLLAEDNPVNQKVASRMLEKLGLPGRCGGKWPGGRRSSRTTPYPLIFMDCQMPEMDGFEATALIRKIEGASGHTPIIAMTANAMKGDREKCLAAGMDDYVAKPIRPKDLQTILDAWLAEARRSVCGLGHAQIPTAVAVTVTVAPSFACCIHRIRQLTEQGRALGYALTKESERTREPSVLFRSRTITSHNPQPS